MAVFKVPVDTFITYKNVKRDMSNASHNLSEYKKTLNEKIDILKVLIGNYNDGRKKNIYCLAVNLFPLPILKDLMVKIESEIDKMNIDNKEKVKLILSEIEMAAKKCNVEIVLRK